MSEKMRNRVFGAVFLLLSIPPLIPVLMLLPGFASLGWNSLIFLSEAIINAADVVISFFIIFGIREEISLKIQAAALFAETALFFVTDIFMYTDAVGSEYVDNLEAFVIFIFAASGVMAALPAIFMLLLSKGRDCRKACIVFTVLFAAEDLLRSSITLGGSYMAALIFVPTVPFSLMAVYLTLTLKNRRLKETAPSDTPLPPPQEPQR